MKRWLAKKNCGKAAVSRLFVVTLPLKNMKTSNDTTTFRSLWQRLTPLYDDREAQSIMRWVLEDHFGMTYTDIICGGVGRLDEDARLELEQIMQKLAEGCPVQYVLGESTFCGRTFSVGPETLIPRPETEQLVTLTKEAVSSDACTILDVGTGSGCIAITLAGDLPRAEVTAWDIAADTLAKARSNAEHLGVAVTFSLQDALHAPNDHDRWDIIVSNPPYIAQKERKDMHRNVLAYEPERALFVPDDDPLCFYRAIAQYGVDALRSGGRLFFEINPLYVAPLCEMLGTLGYVEMRAYDDEFGKKRFVSCKINR